MTANPLVSIIIVNYNGGQLFADCLKSLTDLTYPNWELIVVDNGSTDQSEQLIKKYNLKYKRYELVSKNKNLGFAEGNNQGLKKASGELILLLNNDTKVSANFLSVMVKKMQSDPSIGVMQPKIFLMDKPGLLDNAGTFLTSSGFLQHWGFMQKNGPEFDQQRLIFSAKGACLLTRKEIIDKIGLFDHHFVSYFEESDFCWRVWLIGYKVLYYPQTSIEHKLGATSIKMNQTTVNYHSFKNRIFSLFVNLETKNLLTIFLLQIIIVKALGFYYLVTLQFNKSYMIWLSLLWNLTHLPLLLSRRKKIQALRTTSDDDIFKFTMESTSLKEMFLHFRRVEANFK